VSRVGLLPIVLPKGVEVATRSGMVDIKGPKGSLSVPYDAQQLTVAVEDGVVRVQRSSDDSGARALHGLVRSLVANATAGVTEGFSKRLEVHGVGFRAEVQGRKLTMSLGFSHPVVFEAPEGVDVKVQEVSGGAQARITVSGIDKQAVGQVAADIRSKRKPEPYKGKGIRYENEVIHWKTGKAATS
jgi:large subunit ribosomal protein L6